MRKKNLPRAAVLVLVGMACVFVLLIVQIVPLLTADIFPQRPPKGTTFLRQPPKDVGLPVRLKIPAIEVDAAIESVGLTKRGEMGVPQDPDNVGWYNLGSRPGEKGSAVLAGHLDWYKGKKAVFQNLSKLRVGDLLSVETDDGRFVQFYVREIRTYTPTEYVPEVFQKNDGRHLNLVTCGGVWNKALKIYDQRLVIFTDAVEANRL